MDDLFNLIAGDQPAAETTPAAANTAAKKDYSQLITDKVLNGLKKTESSGDPYAINKDSKAMGAYQFTPSTVAMLHKQGIKFNPFDEPEARDAAKQYLTSMLNKNGGDLPKAIAQYGGFVTKDPSKYQKSVLGEQPTQSLQQTAAQPVQQASSDLLFDLIAGTSAAAPQTETIGGGRGGQGGPTAEQQNEIRPNNVVQKTLQNALNLRNQAPGFATSALDVIGNFPSAVAGTVGYWSGRAGGLTDKEATASAGKVSGALANPFGRMTGMAETPEYQNATPTRIQEIIGSLFGKGAEAVGQKYGISPTDIEQGVSAAMMAVPFAKAPIGRGVNAIKAALPEYTTQVAGAPVAVKGAMGQSVGAAEMSPKDIASMQATFASKRGELTQPTNAIGQSIGAAATTDAARFAELMTRASPEVQMAVKAMTDAGHKVDTAGLNALENHINFEEFGMKATPGEESQNVALLSDEHNAVKSNPELAARLQERDPKLIEGFNKIKEEFAPEAHAVTQPERATVALEGLKEKYLGREADTSQKYQALRDANGGEFPIDGKSFADNAIKQLHKDLSYEATPPVLLKALERFSNGEAMTFEQFERLRTLTATEMRKGGTEGDTAVVIRQALEDLPLTGDAATTLKPLADAARKAAREQKQLMDPKSPKYNAAYTAAANDTRSAAEIALGVPHPASANFFDKHVIGKGASEMQLRRTIDELAGNQAALDELRAGTIHEAKTKSGVKDDTGSVSQAALNDFINNQMTGKLDVALGAEGAAKLRRLSDVATKSDHVRKGGYANVSNTAIAQTPSPIAEKFKSAADVTTQGALTAAHPLLGFGYGVLKAGLKGRSEAKAIAKAATEQEKVNKAAVAPGGGITYTPLSQIGKK